MSRADMASRVGEYLLFDTLGQGSFAKYVWPWGRCSEYLRLRVGDGEVGEGAQWVLVVTECAVRCVTRGAPGLFSLVSAGWRPADVFCGVDWLVCLLRLQGHLTDYLSWLLVRLSPCVDVHRRCVSSGFRVRAFSYCACVSAG